MIIDSIDTLCDDFGSVARTYKVLSDLLAALRARNGNFVTFLHQLLDDKSQSVQRLDSSRLVLHVLAPSPLIPLLVQPKFSASLVHIIAHPSALLTHLSTEYMTSPPPLSAPEKFWSVFIPVAERHDESEKLVFGSAGSGSGERDFVVEVLVRGADGSGKGRRAVERVLEGWSSAKGSACELNELENLRGIWTRRAVEAVGVPTCLRYSVGDS